MECTWSEKNLNYVVHSSELVSELVVDTKLKPCALLVHKGVTFSLSTTVVCVTNFDHTVTLYFPDLLSEEGHTLAMARFYATFPSCLYILQVVMI